MKLLKDYPYVYETHFHTSKGSACAKNTPIEMVNALIEAGYAGVIITEHNWGGNTCVNKSLPWETWVDQFAASYREILHYTKDKDFDVFWGYEAGFDATEFLIYGVSPEWLKAHPEIRDADMKTHLDLVRAHGGLVVHAHPFREAAYIPEIRLFPELTDAVEGINATHSNPKSYHHKDPEYDARAIRYAKQHGFPMTAGSDLHKVEVLDGGVAFRKRLTSIQDYCNAIKNGGDYMLTNGVNYFDKDANIIKD